MAEVVLSAGFTQQVTLIAGLRWRLFRNSLRTTSGKLDLLALTLVSALSGFAVAGIGLAFAAGAYYIVAESKLRLLALLLWGIFFAWHFLPVLLATSTASFDFRNLLRFPLRFSVFFLLSLAYGLFDPVAVAALFWLVCIAVGISLARPDLLPWTLLIFALFAAMNLLLSRMIFTWVERLLARRRTREAVWVLLMLVILGFQLSGAFVESWSRRVAPVALKLPSIAGFLPPGLAGRALASAARGHAAEALSCATLVAAYGLVFALFLRHRLREQYLGEDLGESQAPAAPAAYCSVSSSTSFASLASFSSSFLRAPVAAVLEKELRYIRRNSVLLMNLALAPMLIGFFAVFWSRPQGRPDLFARSPELMFPSALAYMFLLLSQLGNNAFAYEGRGIQLLFLAPVRFRDVLLAKNLTLGLIVAGETALVWLLLSLLLGSPGAATVTATLAALLLAMLVQFTTGNLLSLCYPRRLEFGALHRQRAAGMTMLIGLLVQIAVFGLVGTILLVTRRFGGMWLAGGLFLGLSAIAGWVYVIALERCDHLAGDQREVLTSQLAR